jgi:hypothetical protein
VPLRPIEHDHRGRDFREAADLPLLARLAFAEDVPALVINDDKRLRGERSAARRE